jgi:hypothetical protein
MRHDLPDDCQRTQDVFIAIRLYDQSFTIGQRERAVPLAAERSRGRGRPLQVNVEDSEVGLMQFAKLHRFIDGTGDTTDFVAVCS